MRQFLLFRDLDEPDLWLATDGTARWGEMNGAHRPELDGCYDVDLVVHAVHATRCRSGGCRCTWATAPSCPSSTIDVETLDVARRSSHRYMRLDTHRWAFAHDDESVEFDVDQHGLVLDYPGDVPPAVSCRRGAARTSAKSAPIARVVEGQIDDGAEPAERGAGVVAGDRRQHAVERARRRLRPQRVGELDLAAAPGCTRSISSNTSGVST